MMFLADAVGRDYTSLRINGANPVDAKITAILCPVAPTVSYNAAAVFCVAIRCPIPSADFTLSVLVAEADNATGRDVIG